MPRLHSYFFFLSATALHKLPVSTFFKNLVFISIFENLLTFVDEFEPSLVVLEGEGLVEKLRVIGVVVGLGLGVGVGQVPAIIMRHPLIILLE